VIERVRLYKLTADEHACPGMLSRPEVNRFRDEIVSAVNAATLTLKDVNLRDFNAAGMPGNVAIEASNRRILNTLLPQLVSVVNTEIEVLRAYSDVNATDVTRESPAMEDSGNRPRPVVVDGPQSDRYIILLSLVLKKQSISFEAWASEHRIGRTTLFDWKARRIAGKPLRGKVSADKATQIERTIEADARKLGLLARTDTD
jgi:hypothetical protein